nr:hypothetical protein [Tanacetum cinerariifolium]
REARRGSYGAGEQATGRQGQRCRLAGWGDVGRIDQVPKLSRNTRIKRDGCAVGYRSDAVSYHVGREAALRYRGGGVGYLGRGQL